jgi:hypothetical protein
MADPIIMWTVYDHPVDHPDSFVARKFEIDSISGAKPTTDVIVAKGLDRIRLIMMARGLTCLARDEGDDPKIIETWI